MKGDLVMFASSPTVHWLALTVHHNVFSFTDFTLSHTHTHTHTQTDTHTHTQGHKQHSVAVQMEHVEAFT